MNGKAADHAGDARPALGGHADACVYTLLLGGYEQLNEQPVSADSSVRFVCLTDDPDLRSESWEIRQVEPVFARDPIRSQRDLKIRPHLHMPEFARSVYIDNSVILKVPPESLLDMAAQALDGILMPPHSFRETVLDEFLEVARLGFDDNARIFEQLNHYLLSCPEALDERPWWTAIMVRDHRSARLRAALETWALHVMRYSRRDQLSVNMAMRMAGVRPVPLQIDNQASDLHSWPHVAGRDRDRGERDVAHSMRPLVARLRVAETEGTAKAKQVARLEESLAAAETEGIARTEQAARLEERLAAAETEGIAKAERAARLEECLAAAEEAAAAAEADHQAILHSTSWRITAPLRRAARLSPHLAQGLGGLLRPGRRVP